MRIWTLAATALAYTLLAGIAADASAQAQAQDTYLSCQNASDPTDAGESELLLFIVSPDGEAYMTRHIRTLEGRRSKVAVTPWRRGRLEHNPMANTTTFLSVPLLFGVHVDPDEGASYTVANLQLDRGSGVMRAPVPRLMRMVERYDMCRPRTREWMDTPPAQPLPGFARKE